MKRHRKLDEPKPRLSTESSKREISILSTCSRPLLVCLARDLRRIDESRESPGAQRDEMTRRIPAELTVRLELNGRKSGRLECLVLPNVGEPELSCDQLATTMRFVVYHLIKDDPGRVSSSL